MIEADTVNNKPWPAEFASPINFCLAAVHAELKERNIKLSKKDLTFKTIGQKRHEIRAHVAKEVMVDEGKGQQGFDIKDVKDFVPKAKLMESIKQMHLDWLNEKKGLST